MDNRSVALYMRLSVHDTKTDSMSIENQRRLLHAHLDGLPELGNHKVVEFIDNGFSGTHFERPAMSELLGLVRENKIACILVKDFSRFGRDMLEMGYFIEKVFPLFGTRFIAVNDYFDSVREDEGGIDVTFKYLISEYYSKDLSVKSIYARHAKMKRGEYVSSNTIYGYKLNSDRKMIIDEEVADNVRLIFGLALEGKSSSEIKSELYRRKVLTPGEYKASKGKNYTDTSRTNNIWSQSVILRLLYDERYTGTYIMGKTKVREIGGRHMETKDESEWYKIPNAFPAIIDKAMFDAVQEKLLRFKCIKKNKKDYPLLGKVYCGICGHAMSYKPNLEPSFECRFTHHIEEFPCYGMKISESDLEEIIFGVMLKQAEVILGTKNFADSRDMSESLRDKDAFEVQIEELHNQKRKLYERLITGGIGVEEYKSSKTQLDRRLEEVKSTYSTVASRADMFVRSDAERRKVVDVAGEVKDVGRLTKGLVDALIDRVDVYPGERVEIGWKFRDFSGYE